MMNYINFVNYLHRFNFYKRFIKFNYTADIDYISIISNIIYTHIYYTTIHHLMKIKKKSNAQNTHKLKEKRKNFHQKYVIEAK